MGGPPFKLGTFASSDRRFAGLVMADRVIDLAAIHPHFAKSSGARSGVLSNPGSVLDLLQDWVRNLATLQAISAFIANEGMDDEPVKSTAHPLGALGVLPLTIRPPKLLYAAANRLNKKSTRRNKTQGEPSNDQHHDVRGRVRRTPLGERNSGFCRVGTDSGTHGTASALAVAPQGARHHRHCDVF